MAVEFLQSIGLEDPHLLRGMADTPSEWLIGIRAFAEQAAVPEEAVSVLQPALEMFQRRLQSIDPNFSTLAGSGLAAPLAT